MSNATSKALRATVVSVIVLMWWSVGGTLAQDAAALRLFEQAERSARLGDAERAARLYEDLTREFPRDQRAPVALLRLAQTRWSMGNEQGASAAIGTLRERYADAPSAAGTYVLEGDMEEARAIRRDELRRAYVTLGQASGLFAREIYPDGTWRRQAGVARGRILVLLGEIDLAAAEFLGVVEDEMPGEETPVARLGLSEVFAYQGYWHPAAEILQRVVDGGATEEASDTARQVADTARRRLSLLHRTVFRAQTGQPSWTRVRRIEAPGRGWRDPIGVDVSDDGRVVVADEGRDLALTFDAEGNLLATSEADRLRRPWWGADGQAYVLDRGGVQQPLADARRVFTVPTRDRPTQLTDLRAGARGPLGVIVLVDADRGWVVRFDSDGGYLSTVFTEERGQEIEDVVVDRRGRIWLLDGESNRVLRFGLDGVPEGPVVAREWQRAEAIAVDGVGNLYVVDRDARTVEMFGPDGTLVQTVGPTLPDGTDLRSPRDVAIDASGRLYVADRSVNTVFVLE